MTINEIQCDICKQIIGYTNKRIPETSHKYLYSENLTTSQKCAFMARKKFMTCKPCHEEEMKKAMKEVRREIEAINK